MRIIIILFLFIAISKEAISQASNKKAASGNRATPPKKSEIQAQMDEATNGLRKELADLKKQLKETTDPQEKESLQEQITMLEKQLTMMGGLNKNLSAMSDKTIQQGLEEDAEESAVPKRDITRISSLPKTVLSEAQLALFIKNVHLQIEKMIPPLEKKDATDMYNETMTKHNSIAAVANTASTCWMTGNPEKALYMLGKICMTDLTDGDNLNNYAAFLVMSGGEHTAIPILEYLNAKYPNNSTVLNNIGQAWYGLGDIDKSKKYLDDALEVYKTHSIANSTLSKIYQSKGLTTPSINALKVSLKESYDPEKEAELSRLGYEAKLMDLPRLTVPFPKDPFNITALIATWDPEKIQSTASDPSPAYALQDYLEGVREFNLELEARSVELGKLLHDRLERISKDPAYAIEYVRPHNNPLHMLATRCIYLYNIEQNSSGKSSSKQLMPDVGKDIGGPSNFLAFDPPDKFSEDNGLDFLSFEHLYDDVKSVWSQEVMEPLGILANSLNADGANDGDVVNCKDIDERMNAYYAKRKDIYRRGVEKIKAYYLNRSEQLRNYVFHDLYMGKDDDPEPLKKNDLGGMTTLLISHLERTIEKESKKNIAYQQILNLLKFSTYFEGSFTSACDNMPKPLRKPKAVPLKNYEVKELPCQFVKTIADDDGFYYYKYVCNKAHEKKDKRIKTDKSRGNKGAAYKSRKGNKRVGPSQPGRGPQNDFDEYVDHPAPLTAEEKDPSQFYMEYDKWGKLIGLTFQLNADNSAYADTEPEPSPSETRWTWNAIASAKKSFLNKLIIK